MLLEVNPSWYRVTWVSLDLLVGGTDMWLFPESVAWVENSKVDQA